jgi:hypothetical protein
MSICKNKPKTLIFGRLAGVPAGSSELPTPNFRPIRRDLSPDLAVGGRKRLEMLLLIPENSFARSGGTEPGISYHAARPHGNPKQFSGSSNVFSRSAFEGMC